MHLPYFIAKRYLFAKKSHNVINIISLISAIGIAIGTTALVVVMSVYNGFEGLVKDIYSSSESDLVVLPETSKFFSPDTAPFYTMKNDNRIQSVSEVVEENVFIIYDKHQGVAIIKGVDSLYAQNTSIEASLIEGDFELMHGQIAQAVVGRSLAGEMQIRPRFLDPLEIYYPSRKEAVSIINPISSLRKEVLFPVGIFSLEQNFDKNYIFIPIKTARNLLDYTDEVSSLEIKVVQGSDINSIQKEYRALLGKEFKILNRYQQNETVYKMMTYEKVAIYTILLFIIIVVSCNVFGSLTMLIIEKKDDIQTLKSIGAPNPLVKRIFILEGWMITLSGAVVGLALGVILCLIQIYFGVIKMPGNFIVSSYPVVIKASDVMITFVSVALIGFLITALPAWKILPKLTENIAKED
jgi:lipoprotein-releasing system permease protein